MTRTVLTLLLVAGLAAPAGAQFRRGLGDAREVTLFPIEPPAMLLPSNATVEVVVRNASSAPARIADRVQDLMARQLTDNDPRLQLTDRNGDLVLTATLTEFTESRRNSTKYVSETRQIGTREVIDKNGRKRTEPIYEYGRNRPSVVIRANAAVRVEVRRRQGNTPLADETARHSVSEEHIAEQNPPSRDAVEDQLIDQVIRKAAGRVSPGRRPVTVLLARSDEVDRFNELAQNRRWQEWESSLSTVKPHRDRKRDAYRLHNLAVLQESLAYEAAEVEDALNHLGRAREIITQASIQHPDEKYITESVTRINASEIAYRQVAALQQQTNTRPSAEVAPRDDTRRTAPAASRAGGTGGDTLSNADIIELRAAGLDDDNLIATITSAKATTFDLSPAGLRTLLQAKISNRVIAAMRERK